MAEYPYDRNHYKSVPDAKKQIVKPIVSQGVTRIRYCTRAEIDVQSWNNCIDEASHGLIYAYSYYLDSMTDNWDALVCNGYDAVMPLPWRKKAGIYYLYSPFATAQLGIFGRDINEGLVQAFLDKVPRRFQYWDFPLNHSNRFSVPGYPFYDRVNYVLDLNQPYDVLIKGYSENIRRNIRKSADNHCSFSTDVLIDQVLELNKSHDRNATSKDHENFKRLFSHLKESGAAKIYGVFSAKGEMLASSVFFYSHNRAYYILVGNHPGGRDVGASHALIDSFIRDNANINLLLDFEGSDIEGLAKFYSGFGAQKEIYPAIRLNRLPWYLKWLKK